MRGTLHGTVDSITINDENVYIRRAVAPKPTDQPANVVGGSLDGAAIPPGTRDGQTLTWSADRLRWIGK